MEREFDHAQSPEEWRQIAQHDAIYDLIVLPAVLVGWSYLLYRRWKEKKGRLPADTRAST